MHILFIIIALLLLFVLVPLLVVSLFAYTKLRNLWYKLTGRPQPDPFRGFNGGFNTHTQQQDARQNAKQHTSQSNSSNSNGKKIFSADEGEYVDFEVVD
jgi:hypothetical protein